MTPRLFLTAVSLQARKLMSYRVAFWATAIIAFAAELVVAVFLWRAIFEASGEESIGGFTYGGMLLYYVCALLTAKLVYGRERDLSVSEDIYQGHLTRYLIYPVSYGVFKYAEHLGSMVPSLVQVLLFAGAAGFILPLPSDLGITPATVAMALVSILVAGLFVFALRFTVQLVSFWADNVWSLNVMLRFSMEFLGGLMLPLSLFPEVVRQVLAATPFPYIFYVPVTTLLGRVSVAEWLRGLVVTSAWIVVVVLVARWVWARGNRVYSGVGI
ncbi:MAG: ABC-2 family transporter protein [Acidobacteriota bacterium]